ncbi:MAG: hypothetical protein LAP38_21580 [Acidobacteriia bacterium]|nr:hypothetical protein [Terriglobia bacterium]
MQEIEFTVPPKFDFAQAEGCIEGVCARHGIEVAMKGSLAAYPGSIHWHYKKPKQKGTLELTVFGRDGRIWAQVHTNRAAPWIPALLPKIRGDIERELRSTGGRARSKPRQRLQ